MYNSLIECSDFFVELLSDKSGDSCLRQGNFCKGAHLYVFLDKRCNEREENYLLESLFFKLLVISFYFSINESKKLTFFVGVLSKTFED